ncbi:MAG: hypothetical protein H6536_08110 [Bacteroidales bacterium]|nr:hypothetical protein [Bacteroidales bacterium]
MRNLFFLLVLLLAFAVSAHCQVKVVSPFAAEQSHLELNIDTITFFDDSTVFRLTVENKLDKGGWFCADRSIYVEIPGTGARFYLQKSRSIPTCPNAHSFSRKGERLSFALVFAALPKNLRTINLVEDCNNACFSFKGVILDAKLNADIRTYNQGMEHYTGNRLPDAIACFTKVVTSIPANPIHVYGYSFYHLVVIHQNLKDSARADYWLKRLEQSELPDKQYFIDAVRKNKQGLK